MPPPSFPGEQVAKAGRGRLKQKQGFMQVRVQGVARARFAVLTSRFHLLGFRFLF